MVSTGVVSYADGPSCSGFALGSASGSGLGSQLGETLGSGVGRCFVVVLLRVRIRVMIRVRHMTVLTSMETIYFQGSILMEGKPLDSAIDSSFHL